MLKERRVGSKITELSSQKQVPIEMHDRDTLIVIEYSPKMLYITCPKKQLNQPSARFK